MTMNGLGSPSDPMSFIGFQLATSGRRPGPRRPHGGCGLGCLPLVLALIVLLTIARFF